MSKQQPILVHGGRSVDGFASKLPVLGFRAHRAQTLDEALARAADIGTVLRVALVDALAPPDDVRTLVRHGLTVVVAGERPSDRVIKDLREAGAQIALWEPIDDSVVQFVLGQAALPPGRSEGRRHGRVPTDLKALVHAKAGARTASIHEMSESGAYLATLRPLMKGAVVPIEIRMPSGEIAIEVKVVWSNVIGNLRKDGHPTGMAVRFLRLSDAARSDILSYLGRQLERFRL